jgi:AAA15 family ATPase/GTPase
MRIKQLHINNFKSLVNFELRDLKPFCAFVGPNASGKSNIFEALEFTNYYLKYGFETPGFFGGYSHIYTYSTRSYSTYTSNKDSLQFSYSFENNITLNIDAVFSALK